MSYALKITAQSTTVVWEQQQEQQEQQEQHRLHEQQEAVANAHRIRMTVEALSKLYNFDENEAFGALASNGNLEEINAIASSPLATDDEEKRDISAEIGEESKVGDDEIFNSAWDRFYLICKPEQSGKTFVMIEKINEYLKEDSETDKTRINFIFCDNNLLLVKQTSDRVSRDVHKLPGIDKNYVEFSSKKGAKKSSDEVIASILLDNISNIVCCSNGKRVDDVARIVDKFNTRPNTAGKYVFTIWLDEADKFNKPITKTFLPLLKRNNNVTCYCLTATPESLFQKHRKMNVVPLKQTTRDDYHGWCDNDIRIRENNTSSTEGFVAQIVDELKENNAGIVPPGKYYIPANTSKASHEIMRSYLVCEGFAVFIVNGNGIELTLPNGERIVHPKTKELQEHIREMYRDHGLSPYPVAITGHICISRGITMMQPKTTVFDEFIFDYGILSNCSKKSEVSQQAGRLKGNIKTLEGYKAPIVYCTPKFNKIAGEMEECSRKLATIAFGRDEINPSEVTRNEYRNITRGDPYERDYHVFPDDVSALSWIQDTQNGLGKTNMRPCLPVAPKTLLRDGNNPTLDYVLTRWYGIDDEASWVRQCRLNTNEVVVYWRKDTGCPAHYVKPNNTSSQK